jgi:hypothetical protein
MADTELFIEVLKDIHREEVGRRPLDTVRALRKVTNNLPELVPNSDGDFVFGVAKARLRLAA